jgi:hypothetical protein
MMGNQYGEDIPEDKKRIIKSFIEAGMPYDQIKELTGVAMGSITRIKKNPTIKVDEAAIALYQKERASRLVSRQLRTDHNIQRLNDAFDRKTEEDLDKLSVGQLVLAKKGETLSAAVDFDKERLETDQSTQNVSMIVAALDDLQRRKHEGKA